MYPCTFSVGKVSATVLRLPATVFITLITLYQWTLSPDHGLLRHFFPYGFCRHHPTCSEHAMHVLKHKNLARALAAITLRVLQCHPWHTPSDERIASILKRLDV